MGNVNKLIAKWEKKALQLKSRAERQAEKGTTEEIRSHLQRQIGIIVCYAEAKTLIRCASELMKANNG